MAEVVSPSVSMMRHTPGPNAVVFNAIGICRAYNTNNILKNDGQDVTPKGFMLISDVLDSGHTSILEHVTFTFLVTGMSLVARTQLFRHRLSSPTEQSKRAIEADNLSVVMPKTIEDNFDANVIFTQTMAQCYLAYRKLRQLGIPKEDARYLMPQGLETAFIISYNARELYESVFPDRMCRRSQWEVRDAVTQMYNICMGVMPQVFKKTGPRCLFGKCREKEKCTDNG